MSVPKVYTFHSTKAMTRRNTATRFRWGLECHFEATLGIVHIFFSLWISLLLQMTSLFTETHWELTHVFTVYWSMAWKANTSTTFTRPPPTKALFSICYMWMSWWGKSWKKQVWLRWIILIVLDALDLGLLLDPFQIFMIFFLAI